MAIRVAHIGTGNVGRLALSGLINSPRFELTGVCVSSDAKVGVDAGHLAGLNVLTGIAATNELDALLATDPECVVYCAMADNRMGRAMKDVGRILAAGINVVGSAPVPLQYPWHVLPDQYIAPLEDAARAAGLEPVHHRRGSRLRQRPDPVRIRIAPVRRIEQVRCMEIADYATYDGATVMFDVMGFGKPLDEIPLQLQPGAAGHGVGIVDPATGGRTWHRCR